MSTKEPLYGDALELADIFARYGSAYLQKYGDRMPTRHKQVMQKVLCCRTPALGGQVYECEPCFQLVYAFHSCQDRHCPKCGGDHARHWLVKQHELLVDVPYYMVTFTLPQEFRRIVRSHQKVMINLLFSASAAALKKLALDEKYIGGALGFMGVYHSWSRVYTFHPHVHYLVPGGALTIDGKAWRFSQRKFLLPEGALAKIFRGKFRDSLKKSSPSLLAQVPVSVWRKDKEWVVDVKSAGRGVEVLKYMAPYIFRVALSNKNLVRMKDGAVTFRYKESKSNKWRLMTLPAEEFIRRFLQHVLPRGLQKVRYYGWMSHRQKEILQKLKLLLGDVPCDELLKKARTSRPFTCPKCGRPMQRIGVLPPFKDAEYGARRAPPCAA
jgi:Putative transposase/Transposase zinc-binding domain